jgi:hypothetical protein
VDDTAEELALERVDSNVIVRDSFRIDQASDDNAGALQRVAGGSGLANHVDDRLPTESFHGGDQTREAWAGISRGPEPRMVRLFGFRNRRIAQVDPAAVDDPNCRG